MRKAMSVENRLPAMLPSALAGAEPVLADPSPAPILATTPPTARHSLAAAKRIGLPLNELFMLILPIALFLVLAVFAVIVSFSA